MEEIRLVEPVPYQLIEKDCDRVMVTCVRNILDPFESRETVSFRLGQSLRNYLTFFFPNGWGEEYELIVSDNGHVLEVVDLDAIIDMATYISFTIVPQEAAMVVV